MDEKKIKLAIMTASAKTLEYMKKNPKVSQEEVFQHVMKIEKAKGDWRSETKEYMGNGLLQFWEDTWNAYASQLNISSAYWKLKNVPQLGYVKEDFNL